MKQRIRWAGALLPLLLLATTVEAQVFTPTFTSPRLTNDIGIYLSDGPGDLALEGIWRGGPLGLRVGFVDAGDGMLSIGGEFRSPIVLAGAPFGLAWTLGGQALIGDADAAGFQGGLTVGYTFFGSGVAFTPYFHPRIGIVNTLRDDSDWDLELLADAGFDLEFSRNMVLRLGLNFSDFGSDWGVGLAWRR